MKVLVGLLCFLAIMSTQAIYSDEGITNYQACAAAIYKCPGVLACLNNGNCAQAASATIACNTNNCTSRNDYQGLAGATPLMPTDRAAFIMGAPFFHDLRCQQGCFVDNQPNPVNESSTYELYVAAATCMQLCWSYLGSSLAAGILQYASFLIVALLGLFNLLI